jgi:hypothetical protein
MIQLELYELKNLCKDMAELGAANYAKILYPAKDNISQREAFKQFGEARVKDWIRRELVTGTRNGSSKSSKILYSRAELLSVEKSEKLNFTIKNKRIK